MKWSEMKPTERNALVAEKVMGQTQHLCNGTSLDFLEMPGEWRCGICGYQARYDAPIEHNAVPPRYSEEMNDAMHVIKKIRNDYPCTWHITIDSTDCPILITLTARNKEEVTCQGASLTETICFVALRFLGVEFE